MTALRVGHDWSDLAAAAVWEELAWDTLSWGQECALEEEFMSLNAKSIVFCGVKISQLINFSVFTFVVSLWGYF